MTLTFWIIAPAVAALASALLLAFALRGRRVDDHPICRRCGFDLFGRPRDSTVCSECGADLGRPRAIRVGRRERRHGIARVALPVLLLSVGWLGVAGWREARRTDWNRHKPLWWLAREVDGRSPAARNAALAELARRVAAGETLTLLCSSACTDPSRCHRTLLQRQIEALLREVSD